MEQDPNLSYLFVAYTAFWIVIFGYVLHLRNRQKGLDEAISQLQERLSE